jgi:hypothetical protein
MRVKQPRTRRFMAHEPGFTIVDAFHQDISPWATAWATGARPYARFADHPGAQGITKKEFARVMQRLLDAGVIEIRTWGRPSRPTQYLALSGEG